METDSLTGRLLVAAPALRDPNFDRTVVLLLQHSEEGAVGVVLNRPSETEVHEALPEWRWLASQPAVLFVGGPVQTDGVLGLGERQPGAAAVEGETLTIERVGPVDLTRPDNPDLARVRVFAGYAGWGPLQLEGELEEHAWFVVAARPGDAFAEHPERLWHDVLSRQPGELRLLANFPPDPSAN
jgi:putative transcriptional regulator